MVLEEDLQKEFNNFGGLVRQICKGSLRSWTDFRTWEPFAKGVYRLVEDFGLAQDLHRNLRTWAGHGSWDGVAKGISGLGEDLQREFKDLGIIRFANSVQGPGRIEDFGTSEGFAKDLGMI